MSLNAELIKPHVPELEMSYSLNTAIPKPVPQLPISDYHSFIENAVVGMFQVTVLGHFVMTNPMLAQIYGYESSEELLENCENLKAKLYVNSSRHSQLIEILQQKKTVQKFESQVYQKDGRQIWISENIRAIFDSEEQLIGYEGTAEDITERKTIELSSQQASQHIQKLCDLKSHFVSMVSHEFRSSLTVILAANSLLKLHSQKMTPNQRHKYFDKISEVVHSTTELIDGFLSLSRSETGSLQLIADSIDLSVFCQDIWQDVQTVTKVNSPLKFVNSRENATAIADSRLLRQILFNLLLNAVKYSPLNSPVELEIKGTYHQIIFTIKDYGIGIPPTDQKNLFKQFHRAQNVTKIAGTGLGLAIVKQAIDLHGGTISVESELGIGSTFTVHLPTLAGSLGTP